LARAIGTGLDAVVPEMAGLLDVARKRPDRLHQAEISVVRQDHALSLIVNIAAERLDGHVIGYVVTFDNITELLSAQRTAAWADVARRIAHEIKNPLTPIRLSAERLQRKYLKQIKEDPKTFSNCVQTIVRQVEDIGRMVDEFSSFARMPQATLKPENLSEICRQAAFLERARNPATNYDLELGNEDIHISCDRRQINQALTNIFKNAAESIEARATQHYPELSGTILLRLRREPVEAGGRVVIAMEDNGLGLPEEGRERLTEPYVTTRDKGTGLGLAIVRKIMEEHHGVVALKNRDEGGALISLVFHPDPLLSDAETDAGEPNAVTPPDPMEVATRILTDVS
jgi:two-component system nitrogen regulation sensor histidine kinase NtrY